MKINNFKKMYVVCYIFTIFLSCVLCANIKVETSAWNDFTLKNPTLNILSEYGKESRCIDEDSIHFVNFYQALNSGLDLAKVHNVSDSITDSDFKKFQNSLNIKETNLFCLSLQDVIPKNISFAKLLTEEKSCLNLCFCKNDLLNTKTPDPGCILLNYIYSKIEDIQNNKNKKEEIVKTTSILPKVSVVENAKVQETLKPIKENEIAKTSTDVTKNPKEPVVKQNVNILDSQLQENQKKNYMEKDEGFSENNIASTVEDKENVSKAKTEDSGISLPKIEDNESSVFVPKNEGNIISVSNTNEKSIEQEKNTKGNNDELMASMRDPNDESYETDDENIQTTENSKLYKNQPSSNENIYPNQIISKKYYTAQEDTGSSFFTYLFMAMFLTIVLYVIYHNKTKILALILEGRRGKSGRGRRKHTASYSKLDSNLEEAISSPYSGRSSQIIY